MGGFYYQNNVNQLNLLLLAYILIVSNDTDCRSLIIIKKKLKL